MVVEVATLKTTLVADTSAYTAGLSRADAQSRKFERNSKKSMGAVGTAAKSMAKTGGVALGVGLAVGIKKSVDAFREQQKVSRQTDAALRSTSKAAGLAKRDIEGMAASLSKKTGIDDEAIQSTENLLLTFTKIKKTGGVFKQATALALDMSTALGTDAKSAAMQLGKALNDPIKGAGALARSGIDKTAIEHAKALAESGKKLQAQKYLLKEVATEFGGSAAAVATPMDHLMVTLDAIGEKIGGVVVPLMDKGAAALNRFLTGVLTGSGAAGDFADKVSAAFNSVFGPESGIGQDISDIVSALGKISGAAMRVFAAISKRALPGIVTAFKGFAQIVRGLVRIVAGILTLNFGKAWDGIKDIFGGGFKMLRGLIRAQTAPIREGFARIWDGISDNVSKAWRSVYTTLGGWINKIIGLINKIPGVNIGKINMGSGRGNAGTGEAYHPGSPKTGGGRAVGGYIGKPGEAGGDNVPVMLGRGEAVLNRHQQGPVNAALMQAYGFGLNGLFNRVKKPHYMAKGGVVGMAKGGILGTGINWPSPPKGQITGAVGKYVLSKAKSYVNKLNPFGGGSGKAGGPSGLGTFDGLGVAKWIIPALKYARKNGWQGRLTSGYRSHAYNVAQGRNYYSNHEGVQYPGGAVDVGGWGAKQEGAALNASLAGYRGRKLVWGGPTIGDWGHFSANGHARGGFVGRMARGGKVGLGGLKSLWTKVGGPPKMASLMAAIAMGESGGNPGSVNHNTNGTVDKGLWQINSVHGYRGNMFNPTTNARAALKIYRKQGLGAWVAYTNGSYRKYLAAARKAKGGGAGRAKKPSKPANPPKSGMFGPRGPKAPKTPNVGGDFGNIPYGGGGRGDMWVDEFPGRPDAGGGSGGGSGGGEGSGVDVGALLVEIRNELKRLNATGDATRNVVRGEIEQGVLDFFNNGIGGRLAGGARLASAGVSY